MILQMEAKPVFFYSGGGKSIESIPDRICMSTENNYSHG